MPSSFFGTDEDQQTVPDLMSQGTDASLSSKLRPRLRVNASVCSETLPKSGSAPFRLIVRLENPNPEPLTISKTTRVLDIPTALHKRCIIFRDLGTGRIVHHKAADANQLYEPYRVPGIPKRWKVESRDLISIPSCGVHTVDFDLTGTDSPLQDSPWPRDFEVGNKYEVSVSEGTCVMFWSHSTIDELVSVQALLGPEWPQDHLPLDVISDTRAIFTVAG